MISDYTDVQNMYPTNILLHKIGIRNNNQCKLCDEKDYLEHFFWRCKNLIQFWKNVQNTICRKTNKPFRLKDKTELIGFELKNRNQEPNKFINHLLLIAKMTITKYRYGERFDINCIFDLEVSLRC